MLGGHFGVLIPLLMADRNSAHSDPGINSHLCASAVDQACESDPRGEREREGEKVTLLFCSACLCKRPENESISQNRRQ